MPAETLWENGREKGGNSRFSCSETVFGADKLLNVRGHLENVKSYAIPMTWWWSMLGSNCWPLRRSRSRKAPLTKGGSAADGYR